MGVKLVSSSAGSVELVAPVTASNYTATMPAKTGTVMIDGPAFSAYQSSSQSITSSTFTKVNFQTEDFDTASAFNNTGSTVGSTPAYAFLPTVAGYYQVIASVGPATSTTATLTAIYKNGSQVKSSITTAVNSSAAVTALIYLNGTTDYVESYAYVVGVTPALNAGVNYTYFQASLVRGA